MYLGSIDGGTDPGSTRQLSLWLQVHAQNVKAVSDIASIWSRLPPSTMSSAHLPVTAVTAAAVQLPWPSKPA